MSETFILIAVNAYLLVMLGVGIYHSRRVDLIGFTTERGRVSFWPLVGTLVATGVGGGVIVGMVTMGFEGGTVGYVVSGAYLVGFLVLAWLAPTIRRALEGTNGTLLDFFGSRFDRKVSALTGLVFCIVMFLFLSAQYVAFAAFLKYTFTITFEAGLILAAAYLILYTMLGGLRSVIATDLIQLICIVLSSVWLLAPVLTPSELSRTRELPEPLLNGTAYGLTFLIGAALFLWPTLLVRIDVWQRVGAAVNDRVARRALVVSGLFLALFMAFYTTMGMVARIEFPNLNSNTAVFAFVDQKLHAVGTLMCFVAITSAVMSSADTILNVLAICLVKMTPFGRNPTVWSSADPEMSRRVLLYLRLTTVLVGIVTLAVAFLFPNIVELNVAGLSALLVFLPALLEGMFSKKPNAKAAFIGIGLGTVGVLAVLPLAPKMAFLPGVLLSVLAHSVARVASRRQG